MRISFWYILVILVLMPLSISWSAGENIPWQATASGGSTNDGNGIYFLGGTVGQATAGFSTSGTGSLYGGFWQDFAEPAACDCHPGDANNNIVVNILDIIYLINSVYKSGPSPIPYGLCSGDPNGNCVVNILDIIYLINSVYKGGPEPVTCGQWVLACGQPLRK